MSNVITPEEFYELKTDFTRLVFKDQTISLEEVKNRGYYCVDQAQINAKNSLQQTMDICVSAELVRNIKDMHFKEVLPNYQTDIAKYIKTQ